MPRRKQHTLLAIDLPCYKTIVEDLSKLPELAEGYDMGSIKISVLKKIEPFIKNIDATIKHFERYTRNNKDLIPMVFDEEAINRVRLAKMLGVSRQTLSDWIEKGFIIPEKSKYRSNTETFSTKAVLEQLKRYKAEH